MVTSFVIADIFEISILFFKVFVFLLRNERGMKLVS